MKGRERIHQPTNLGDKIADAVVTGLGSWKFIIIQTVIVAIWIISNAWLLTRPFDPFPLILLNLVFSTQAAYASPLILMAGNRQASRDRARDNLEAQEVDALTSMNKQQLAILEQEQGIKQQMKEALARITEMEHYLDQQNTLYAQLVQELQQRPLDVRVTSSALPHDERKGKPA